jgi:hypothetical protein
LWTRKSLEVLARLFRGGTAFPPGLGVWRDAAEDSPLLFDETVVVHCYTRLDEIVRHAASLREFLIEMGLECNQAAVGYVIDGVYLEINMDQEQGK